MNLNLYTHYTRFFCWKGYLDHRVCKNTDPVTRTPIDPHICNAPPLWPPWIQLFHRINWICVTTQCIHFHFIIRTFGIKGFNLVPTIRVISLSHVPQMCGKSIHNLVWPLMTSHDLSSSSNELKIKFIHNEDVRFPLSFPKIYWLIGVNFCCWKLWRQH